MAGSIYCDSVLMYDLCTFFYYDVYSARVYMTQYDAGALILENGTLYLHFLGCFHIYWEVYIWISGYMDFMMGFGSFTSSATWHGSCMPHQ
jgi:hypothetical protein